ncbi:DUF1963 domain-containing protein [Streptomyces caniscabiei]|nr:DUF1963 domain-containing protein [Streptomyces caniscabiei]MDX2600649.1 DUF1963 domain-containing protein [Streptomyces caniscabiei]MDX2736770.1 DUF1963 domain-containing protein [Streptomyces caniscabiei]MDX2777917.1 DUF1963 domain-containing protein [Streptomyces caniscabiei]
MDPFRAEARGRGVPEDEVERWLRSVRRPCVTLSPDGQVPEGGVVAGRLGGLPPMPEGEPVPDLPFLASVDLAALPPGATGLPLPADGTLLFFADTEDPWDDDWSRLVYVPVGTPVSERAPEADWPPDVIPMRDLRLSIDPSLPNRGTDTEEFPHGGELGSVWWKTSGAMQTDGPVQLGGHPWVWNTDPLTDHDHGPGDWVLLAEVGGDDLTEGDLGIVHWVIRRDDLAAGRFTEARACFDMAG